MKSKSEQIKREMYRTRTGVGELAKAIGMSRVSVSNWIHERNEPIYENYILAMEYMKGKTELKNALTRTGSPLSP